MKELKKDIAKVTKAMNQLDGKLRAEIRCMGGKDIDSVVVWVAEWVVEQCAASDIQ